MTTVKIDDLVMRDNKKYDNPNKLNGIQTDPKEMKTTNFKQDYVVIIRKKLYYAISNQDQEKYLRVYQVNNFLNIRTSHSVYGRPATCSLQIKGGERVICAEREEQDMLGWESWNDLLYGWVGNNDIGEEHSDWRIGNEKWNVNAKIDFRTLLKAREAKYGWRFAEKCDWEPMDEIYVFGKTRNEKYKKANGDYEFLPLFFGYIDSVSKTYQAGAGNGLVMSIQASDQLKLLQLSRVVNTPSKLPGVIANGGLEINYHFPQDEVGCFAINDDFLQGMDPENAEVYATFTNVFAGLAPYKFINKLALDAGIPQMYLEKRIEKIEKIPFIPQLRSNGAGDFLQAETKERLSVCKEAAEKLFLEFFADESGNIVLKIPNYSLGCNRLKDNNMGYDYRQDIMDNTGPRYVDSNGLVVDLNSVLQEEIGGAVISEITLKDVIANRQIKLTQGLTLSQQTDHLIPEIKPEDIISFTLTDTDREIYNMYEIQMDIPLIDFQSVPQAVRRVVPDFNSIVRFGLRPAPGVVNTPLISNVLEAEIFGTMMVTKSLANRYSGTVNMIEDSSIHIGDPIRLHMYDETPFKETGLFPGIKSQAVFYIVGIERSIDVRNVSHMSLQLKAGRMMGQESVFDISVSLYKYYYEGQELVNFPINLDKLKFEEFTKYTTKAGDTIAKIITNELGVNKDEDKGKKFNDILQRIGTLNWQAFGGLGNTPSPSVTLQVGIELRLPKNI